MRRELGRYILFKYIYILVKLGSFGLFTKFYFKNILVNKYILKEK